MMAVETHREYVAYRAPARLSLNIYHSKAVPFLFLAYCKQSEKEKLQRKPLEGQVSKAPLILQQPV